MNEQDIFEVRQTDVEIQEIFDQVPKNTKAIEDINDKLPAEASAENPLADKEYVDGKVGTEKTRAEGAEQTLQGNIDTETQARQQADQTLDGKIAANTQAIAAEKARAEGAEQTLQGNIDTETQARQQADTTLDGKITANTQAIAAEKTRAEGAEQTLQGNLYAETQARQQADQTLDGKIAANTHAIANEQIRAEGAEQTLAEELNALNQGLNNGEVVPAQAADIESWKDTSALVPYIHKTAQETTGGDISIRSDVQARLDGIVPTSRRWKATKLVACGTNLLRPTSQTGGIATAIGTGIYFPCPALTFGTYGTAQENNGVVFTDSNHAFLTPTVYMKRIADGVPTSVTDGVQAQTVSGQNGETFYVNPASLSGEAVYVIVSGITLASSCAHIAWSGNGTPYNYYIAPDAAAPANVEIALASLLTAIGNDGYLTQVGGLGDMLLYEDNTHMRCTRRNGRVQPTWTTEAEEVEGTPTGNYIHTATIGDMLSDGAAELEADGTRLQVSGTEVSYTDQSETATTDYVLYNLATETSSVVDVSPMLTVNDFGLIVLLGNDGTADTTIGYAQGIADSVRALMTGGYDEVNRVIAEALNALHSDNVRLAALVMELEKKTTPLTSATAGAPSAANTPEGWNADRYGAWQGWPAYVGQEYIDTASQKLYKALAHTGSVSDWVVMN